MKSEPDASDPFSFEGPEIIDCEGYEPKTSTVAFTHVDVYVKIEK